MLKEFSYGAVVYKIKKETKFEAKLETRLGAKLESKLQEEPLFALVRSKRNGNWGFPKGHEEKNESPLHTARREIYEETGIREIKFIKYFQRKDVYLIDGFRPETAGKRVEKHSIYFLVLALSEPEKEHDEEIEDFQWFDFNAALGKLSFKSQKEILKDAYEIIKALITKRLP